MMFPSAIVFVVVAALLQSSFSSRRIGGGHLLVDAFSVVTTSSSPRCRRGAGATTTMMTAPRDSSKNDRVISIRADEATAVAGSEATRTFSRRQATIGGAAAAAMGFLAMLPLQQPARAADDSAGVGTCPRGSQNCIRTTWTPPANTSPSQASRIVKEVLESYPQEGYDGVDLGGWTLVDDQFGTVGEVSRAEFKSGIGNFAKFLNGGKPFVDDLRFQVDSQTGAVQVRSNSRVGDSDLGVNKKRLAYFVKALTAKGWDAPEPTY